MKKIIGLGIIGFILVVGSINAGATSTVPSDGVLYSDSGKTVKEALDELFTDLKEKQTEIDNLKKVGNASASQILKDKIALVQGVEVKGSMSNYSNSHLWVNGDNGTFYDNLIYTYSSGTTTNEMVGFQSNKTGYFDTTTKFIFGNKTDLASKIKSGSTLLGVTGTYTSDATASAGNILKDKTAYVNGTKVTGTMTNYSEETQSATSITQSGTDALISIPSEGYYDTSSNITVPIETIKNELNLTKTLSKKADKSLTATISTLKKVGTVYKNNTEESLHCYALAYTTTATEVTVFQSIFYIGTKQVSSYIVEGGVKIQSTTTVPFTLGAGETLYLYASNTSYKEGSNTFRTILYCY